MVAAWAAGAASAARPTAASAMASRFIVASVVMATTIKGGRCRWVARTLPEPLQAPPRSARISLKRAKDADDQQRHRCLYRRESRGRARLHGELPRLRRAALVHECARRRTGVLQLAQDAAGHRR